MTTSSHPPIGEPVLDASKKEVILRLASEGFSRRSIARIVGCAPSTITRTARRDGEFGIALALAEETLQRNALQTLNRVVLEGKYWRAAAWVAERLMPERFARRAPQSMAAEEADNLLREIGSALLQTAPAEDRAEAAATIAGWLNARTASEDRFTAEDFLEEDASAPPPEASEKPAAPASKAEELSAKASPPTATGPMPPASPANKPPVQHPPRTYCDPRLSPLAGSSLMDVASALFDRPACAADLLGRCTGDAAALGGPWSGVGLKAKPKAKKRRRK